MVAAKWLAFSAEVISITARSAGWFTSDEIATVTVAPARSSSGFSPAGKGVPGPVGSNPMSSLSRAVSASVSVLGSLLSNASSSCCSALLSSWPGAGTLEGSKPMSSLSRALSASVRALGSLLSNASASCCSAGVSSRTSPGRPMSDPESLPNSPK